MSESLTTAKEQKLIIVSEGRPAYPTRANAAFNITPGDWRALVDAVWPSAKTTEGVELALAYCRARRLDPFKRPVHIVPVWNAKLGREIESVWPGIGELRTTAARTGQHAGYDEAAFGPDETRSFKGVVGKGQYAKEAEKSVTFPVWAQVTVYRMLGGQRVAFPGPKVWWLETYATMGASDVPNEMWETRPRGQLEKCAEAAALRRAFPEEIGSEYIPEEIGRQQRGPAIELTPMAPAESRSDALLSRLAGKPADSAATDVDGASFGHLYSPPGEPLRAQPAGEDVHPTPEPDRPAETAKAPNTAKSRDALVDEIREATKAFTRESKVDAWKRHWLVEDWLKLTKLAPDALAAGLASLRAEQDGIEAMKAEPPEREREPGEEE